MGFSRHRLFGKAQLDALLVQLDVPFLVGDFLLQAFDETQDAVVDPEGDALDGILQHPEFTLVRIVVELEIILQKVLD